MPHQRLLTKVKAHGIDGKVYDWIKASHSGREKKILINGKIFNWDTVNSGVPQESILGSLLFIIYINYFDSRINSNISKFADDTVIERQISSDREAMVLQDEINIMHE